MAINFPDIPTTGQVFQGYTYDGEKWVSTGAATFGAVRYDMPQGLTTNQMAQGRANIGDTKKNYIINGAMQISQENGTTILNVTVMYPVDMFRVDFGHSAAIAFQQLASVTPGGSSNRLQYSVSSPADTSVAAGDYCLISQTIEGARVADLKLGTAAAKTFTLQFGVKAPAGTYCVTFANGANSRAYVAEYVIAAGEANTDVVKTITVAGDVTGTWATDNTGGLFIKWCLMCGTTFQQAAGSWAVATNTLGSPNQYNFMGTVGNIFQLFDVSLTEGTIAPPFQVPDYVSELALCKRYWQKLGGSVLADILIAGYMTGGSNFANSFSYPVEMRAAPAATVVGTWTMSNTSAVVIAGAGARSLSAQIMAATANPVFAYTANATCFIALSARL